ncbi:MAG: hypothetical protein ACJAYU_000026 [Bradymonadia bacterium]|jgi:hypothetical protein
MALFDNLPQLYKDERDDRELVSFITLRRAVGFLGIGFPILLILGGFVFSPCLSEETVGACTRVLPTLSEYYASGARDIFVGVLCVIGFFFFAYRGHSPEDDIAGDLACFFALGVALFPTTSQHMVIEKIHGASALGMFLVLFYFSACLFTLTKDSPREKAWQRVRRALGQMGRRTALFIARKPPTNDPTDHRSPRKRKRDDVYLICGGVILACVLLCLLSFAIGVRTSPRYGRYNPVLILEAVALIAFGFSWLVKGEVFLVDKD